MRHIKTKSKEEFLQHEYDTHFVDILELREMYLAILSKEATCCKNCGIYYWRNQLKRCKCNVLNE